MGPAGPDGGRSRLLGDPGIELLAFPERYDAVAGAGALPDAEERLWPQLRADRIDHVDHAADLLSAAAGGGARLRSPPATLFSGRRHGRDLGRSAALGECR